MPVVKNMLTSNPNKGTYVKMFLLLLLPFVLMGCGESEENAIAALENLGGA